MGINTGWGGGGGASSFSQLTGTLANAQIPNTEIAIGKLNATGTPGSGNYLRGDGAWSSGGVATQHGRYSNNRGKGSTNTNIARFDDAIGTPDTADITHDDANVAANGSIFTVVNAGWYVIDVTLGMTAAGKGINIVVTDTVSNTDYEGKILTCETSTGASYINSLSGVAYLTAGKKIYVFVGGSGVVLDAGASNIDYNKIVISRVIGPGATGSAGATGATGAAGADGAGSDPVTNSLGSAAQSLSLTGLTGNAHAFRFDGVSNAATNDVFLTVNAGTAQTGYTWQFGYNVGGAMAYASIADTSVLRNQLAANERFHVSGTVTRFYDGTNTHFTFDIFCQTPSGIGTGTIYTSAAGDVALTAINLRSSQATGIKSGAVGSAQKVG